MNPNRVHNRFFVVALLALFTLANLFGRVEAAPSPAAPAIALDVSHAFSPGTIMVDGQGFTPGGRVYIALYDRWGVALHETRWVTATSVLYGSDGSQDPARGFTAGGTVRERFTGLCGTELMARAYDAATQTWSAELDVNATNAGSAVYGPDGSQDPARGYRPAC
jgi:hypothetical protein